MTYFENEVWDTGGDGRITITGDIYSTADPFSIYINAVPFEVIEFATAQTEIKNNLNVLGTISINGVPIGGGGNTFTEIIIEKDGDPLIFASLSIPLAGAEEDFLFIDLADASGLAIAGDVNLTGYLDITGNGGWMHSPDLQHSFDVYLNYSGTSTSANIFLVSLNTTLQIQSVCDTITPANDRIYIGAPHRLEFNFDAIEIFTSASETFELNGEVVPSLNFTTTTASTNFTVDWYDGSVRMCVINDSLTISFANPIPGRTYVLIIEQGTGGSRVPTLTGWNFGDNAPVWSTTVGAKDVVSAVYDGTEYLAAQAVQNA
jgi:hypothetical protein